VNELALFAGAGGGILGGHLLGWRTVCAVEWEPYAASVLVQRQNDGILPPFPIWDDVQTFDGRPWRGIVDVVSGGFPCQDISAAGKGAGISGERSGMWREMARIICEVRPKYAFIENSPMLTTRGLDVVLSDLASMGFDARWGVLGAADVGAPHQRDRIWVVADSNSQPSQIGGDVNAIASFSGRGDFIAGGSRRYGARVTNTAQNEALADSDLQHGKRRPKPQQSTSVSRQAWDQSCRRSNEMANAAISRRKIHESSKGSPNKFDSPSDEMAYADSAQRQGNQCTERNKAQRTNACKPSWWEIEPDVGRVADGVAARVDRLKAIGNGQVPAVAATAWKLLSEA
jgi:DNA (cytosine-5)-methyltransferase 1